MAFILIFCYNAISQFDLEFWPNWPSSPERLTSLSQESLSVKQTGPLELWVFLTQIILCFFGNYAPAILNYGLANLLCFTFKTKILIIHFQSENKGKNVVLPPNKSKKGAFFFSKL